MTWGSQYWGGFSETIAARLLYINREGPRFQAISNVLDLHYDAAIMALQEMEAAFDLDTAVGDQLDIIGAQLGLDRLGLEDDRYRRALKVQRTILAGTGTRPNLLQIWEDWTGEAPLSYRTVGTPANAGPEIEIGGSVEDEDQYMLALFLRRAAPAGTIINAFAYDSDEEAGTAAHLLCNYTAADPVRFPIHVDTTDLLWAPDLEDLEDPITGVIGTPVETTWNADEQARDLDGVNDKLYWLTQTNLVGQPFTASFWVYRHTAAVDSHVWYTYQDTSSGAMFVSVLTTGAVRLLWVTSGVTMTRQSAASVVPLNQWVHIVVHGDGGLTAANYTIIIDGEEVTYGATTDGTLVARTTAFRWVLGSRFVNNTNPFDGLISDPRVWNREFTDAEVRSLYVAATGQLDYVAADPVAEAAPLAERLDV